MVEERLDSDLQTILDEIASIRRFKDDLIARMRTEMGLDEIPDLIPRRDSD
jgi:hypothetical protein